VRFWGDVLWLTGVLLLRFYSRGDLLTGALGLAGISVFALLQYAPWRLLLVVAIVLFLYIVALAVYQKFTKVEDRKDELEEKLEERQKYRAAKTSLGSTLAEGRSLRRVIRYSGEGKLQGFADQEDRRSWASRTYELIEEALNKGMAELFWGSREDTLDVCLTRLEGLISGLTLVDVNPDFTPQE
jgi:membrane protein implicated in regulation of membrane protease activity